MRTTFFQPLLALSLLAFSASAQARGIEDDLTMAAVSVDQIEARSLELERMAEAGGSTIGQAEALQRFQDNVYLHMVGNHELAAEGFFALVTTAALGDAGLHRDAEWYLAESLFEMGNYGTAEARFQVIAEDEAHPFRDDAVRRLLETYAQTGEKQKFDDYYNREVVRGRVAASPLITYTVAKSFYQQGDFVRAKSTFVEVPPGNGFYRKARYFMGTILVQEGEFDPAAEYFKEISELSVDTIDDRQVLDLSLLALGRIYYELGQFAEAAEYYGRIGGDSEFLADKLYEIVWTFIKQDEFQEALRAVEIFLLAFPEHEYTAQLKLLEGHLHLQEVAYDSALSAYEQVIIDYTPIRERFNQLAASEEEGREYFQTLARGETVEDGLPAYATAMMLADQDLAHAMGVYQELERQARDIDTSETIIAELQAVLETATGLGGYARIRYDAGLTRQQALTEQMVLLEIEEEWLKQGLGARAVEGATPKRQALLDSAKQIRAEIEAARGRLAQYDTQKAGDRMKATEMATVIRTFEADLADIQAQIADPSTDDATRRELQQDASAIEVDIGTARGKLEILLGADQRKEYLDAVSDAEARFEREVVQGISDMRSEYRSLRTGVTDSALGRQIDDLHTQLAASMARTDQVVGRIDAREGSEFDRVKARFESEVQEVASQRVEHARTLREAEQVSVGLTRNGFGRLEDFFAESVLKADMGVVDVYWAQKLEVADQKERVKEEKQELLTELEERFRLIKQKLRQ